MPEIGQSLSHYSIVEKIGKGGMGEVYRAKDQKLGRDVAIKVLPEEFARDADRVARFQREAKLLASLNHANIAAIHGLEESGGTQFLVLELVEGETLADQIKRGPIPVEAALKLALQIAEALEAAHDKGVIHRDLKPANIKVTPDAKVKVLDFGLAKALSDEALPIDSSQSPTLTEAMTRPGVILGTAAYMSPEQAKGKTVDKRADIWAFGCILFEMLSGQAAFQGEDIGEILASAIKGDLKLDVLPSNTSHRVRGIIGRCLQKELRKRYQDIGDVRYEIEQALTDPGGAPVAPIAASKSPKRLKTTLLLAAGILVLGAIAGIILWNLKKQAQSPVMRFSYEALAGWDTGRSNMPLLAISPDGRRFVYSTLSGLYLRSMDDFEAKRIAGTETNPYCPFFSPDGQWIGYGSGADNKLKKISINGGAPVVLCDAPIVCGAHWGANDLILYGAMTGGIMQVSANGGTPEKLVAVKGETYFHPRFLPGGKSVLFTLETKEGYITAVQSLKAEERRVLFPGDCAWYLPTGHIVYAVADNLFAVPFDLERLEATGGAVSVVKNIFRASVTSPQYAVSDSGTLLYIPGHDIAATVAQRTLLWVDRNGKEEPISAPPNAYALPRISPDGTRVALTIVEGPNASIQIWDHARKNFSVLTRDKAIDLSPLWTSDGKKIAFFSSREGKVGIYLKASDGSGEMEPLFPAIERISLPSSWDADGKSMILWEVYGSVAPSSTAAILSDGLAMAGVSLTIPLDLRFSISMLSMDGDQAIKPLLQKEFQTANPQVSSDGKWMAYASNESGQYEVYVRPFPRVESGLSPISIGGGQQARWSPDGRELFYSSRDGMMAVSVQTTPGFKAGLPKMLFRGTGIQLGGAMWDLSQDGKRFLMMKDASKSEDIAYAWVPQPKIKIVVNWSEELEQRAPTK